LYFLCRSSISGISSRHGPHQDAQKFTITTSPLKSFSDNCFLPKVGRVKLGAAPVRVWLAACVSGLSVSRNRLSAASSRAVNVIIHTPRYGSEEYRDTGGVLHIVC